MSDRIKLVTEESYIELQINPLRSKKFLIFGIFLIICITLSLFYALKAPHETYPYYAIIIWALGFGIIAYLQFCNFYGKVIVTIDNDFITISDQIHNLGLTKQFEIKDVSNIRVAGFMEKIKSPVLGGWLHFKFYDGKVAFDYKDKTYRFGSTITEKDAILVAEKFKNYLKAIKYDSQ
ncbi:MAG: hypothetical protein AB1782_18320 [Cyanobacteriota bacterium]